MKSSNFICTIGPVNNSVERIQRMIYKGLSVVRLNLSHGTLEEHQESIQNLRLAADRVREKTKFFCPLAVAVDIRGPEMRTGKAEKKFVKINDQVKFNDNPLFSEESSSEMLFVDWPVSQKLKKGLKIFLNDGAVELKVEDIFGDIISCQVTKSGFLGSNQSFVIPEIEKHLKIPFISKRDKLALQFAVEHDVDFIFASHVECGENVDEIRSELGDAGKDIKVFAKIQSRYGVDEIEKIVSKADGIVIAPTMNLDANLIPYINRLVLRLCTQMKKTCLITVESEMVSSEVNQVVNWMMESGDGVVNTRGASEGKINPLESMMTLQHIRELALEMNGDKLSVPLFEYSDVPGALASACVTSSITTNASAIIIISNSEEVVNLVYHHQPKCEVIAVIGNRKKALQLNILDHVTPLVFTGGVTSASSLEFAIGFAKKRGIVKGGDTIVALKSEESVMEVHYIQY